MPRLVGARVLTLAATSFEAAVSSSLLRAPFRLTDQLLQGGVDRFCSGIAHPLESNHALRVDHVISRRAARAPFDGDGTARKRPPVQLLLRHHFLEFLRRIV